MEGLSEVQYGLIALCFIWSGFVRSGLGFGGSVLSLPFLLLILNSPLLFLPIISVQLLFFSGLTIYLARRKLMRERANSVDVKEQEGTINWAFLKYAFPIMLIPKIAGVIGVIALPASIVSGVIFSVVIVYAISYILDRPIRSGSKKLDAALLIVGGYVSGTSLIAAPLVVPVAASRMPAYQVRDTLFVLWFVLVAIKLGAFVWSGVDLQLRHHLWLLPCAAVGHVLGLKFHAHSLKAGTTVFFRWVGVGLLLVSSIGVINLFLHG